MRHSIFPPALKSGKGTTTKQICLNMPASKMSFVEIAPLLQSLKEGSNSGEALLSEIQATPKGLVPTSQGKVNPQSLETSRFVESDDGKAMEIVTTNHANGSPLNLLQDMGDALIFRQPDISYLYMGGASTEAAFLIIGYSHSTGRHHAKITPLQPQGKTNSTNSYYKVPLELAKRAFSLT